MADENGMAMLVPTLIALTLILLWLIIPATGGWIVYRGLRARVLDEHERCRRCRYLLFAQPVRALRCPECGAHLTAESILRGARGPRWGMVAGGAAVLLLGLAPVLLLRIQPAAPTAVTIVMPARVSSGGPGAPRTATAAESGLSAPRAPGPRPEEPAAAVDETPRAPTPQIVFDISAPPDLGAIGRCLKSSPVMDRSWREGNTAAPGAWEPPTASWLDREGPPAWSGSTAPSSPALRIGGSAARSRAAPWRAR